jgi:hypothetical protein
MIGAVHEVDRDVWRAIDHGERRIDWDAWFGHPDGADYLTEAGKRVMRRAIGDLTDFFGATWLDRAIQPNGGYQGPRIQGLGASSPVLALAPDRRAGAYVESIRWWANLQLLVEQSVQGYEKVRRDARNDLTTHRLLHTLAQARLATIGAYLGADVAVEPGKQGGPGDVLLRSANQEVEECLKPVDLPGRGCTFPDQRIRKSQAWPARQRRLGRYTRARNCSP